MSEKKYRVPICHDHFIRLARGDVCSMCPSELQNAGEVMALAKALDGIDEHKIDEAVVQEIAGIRETQRGIVSGLEALEDSLKGNGKPGINTRLALIESAMQADRRSNIWMLHLAGVVVSNVIAAIAVIVAIFVK